VRCCFSRRNTFDELQSLYQCRMHEQIAEIRQDVGAEPCAALVAQVKPRVLSPWLEPYKSERSWRNAMTANQHVVPSEWAPLQIAAFRAIWFAELSANVGTWFQMWGACGS
jgi:hypothetical protein